MYAPSNAADAATTACVPRDADATGSVAARAARRIVVCADDFAIDEPVSRAIVELAVAGRIGAAGAMTAGARWPAAWRTVDSLPPGFPLGLHVNLVEGTGLAGGGTLPAAASLAVQAMAGLARRDAIRREIDAQWRAFEDRAGRPPAFVDTHRHVHVLPPVRDALLDAIAGHGGRTPVRNLHPSFGPRGSAAKRLALRMLGAPALAAALHGRGLAANTALGGLQDFADAAGVERGWLGLLDVAPDGAMIAAHPAVGVDPADPIGAFRRAEHAWLASTAFDRACEARGVRRVRLGGAACPGETACPGDTACRR
jgi:predicted glycoside hydrolase/deacetylase ChbG (UPF0249 family)